MTQALTLSRDGEIAELVINQPSKRNAMSYEMWEALPKLVAEVDSDESVKVLVVRGAGDHFCAGADISEFETRRATAEGARRYGEHVEHAAHSLGEMHKPSIALIQGFCIGGGLEIALACDLRFAAATATLGITPAKLGLVYSFSSTRQLVTAVGPSFAKYILFSGERLSAQEALRVHLVDQLVEPERLEAQTLEFASTICSRSQVSVRGAKRMIEKIAAGMDTPDEEAAELPISAVDSEDYKEGVRAFLEKRPPVFRVR
jgi:enoyl-CoA hydratase/carnithine racemase